MIRNDIILDLPPPTMNGKPHIGHVFCYVYCKIISNHYHRVFQIGCDDFGAITAGKTEEEIEENKGHWLEFLGLKEFAYKTSSIEPTTLKYDGNTNLERFLSYSRDPKNREQTISFLKGAQREWDPTIIRENGLISPWARSSMTWRIREPENAIIIRVQGVDIIGTWLFYSLVTLSQYGIGDTKMIAYVHGNVCIDGQKVSKSLGATHFNLKDVVNIPHLRYWVLTTSTDIGRSIPLPDDQTEQECNKLIDKCRNAIKFFNISNNAGDIEYKAYDNIEYLLQDDFISARNYVEKDFNDIANLFKLTAKRVIVGESEYVKKIMIDFQKDEALFIKKNKMKFQKDLWEAVCCAKNILRTLLDE